MEKPSLTFSTASDDPTPPSYYEEYLNQAKIQNALGVSLNYTGSNNDIYYQFQTVCLELLLYVPLLKAFADHRA